MTAEQQNLDAFSTKMQELYAFFASHGCPCRFPRFRAMAARDTREVGAPGFTSLEHQALVTLFDAKVPLRDRVAMPMGHRGICAACGSVVERWGDERFRDAFIEHLRIEPAPGLVEVGEPLHAPLPRCWPLTYVGPEPHDSGRPLVEASYPRVSVDDWFAWIRALVAGDGGA